MKNNVKLARTASNMNQQELARRIGVTRQTISLIEKGKYNPSLKLCLLISYALDKKLDDLFWIREEEYHEKNNR